MKVNFIKAIKIYKSDPNDTWNGKTELQVPKNHGVKVGDSVKVVSPIYNGIFYCEYIYRGGATVDNLYFRDMVYQGDTTGTVEVVEPGTATPTSQSTPGTSTQTSQPNTGSTANNSTNTTNTNSNSSQVQQTITQAKTSIKSWSKNWWFWAILIVLGVYIIKKVKS